MEIYYDRICKVLRSFDNCNSEDSLAESITSMYNILSDIKTDTEYVRQNEGR